MKFLSTFTALLLFINDASATNEIRFIFNNGFAPSANSICSDSELAKVEAIFTNSRFLRKVDSSSSTESEKSLASSGGERELTFLKECKNVCQNFAPSFCHSKGCRGFGRGRNLQQSCIDEINEIHAKLDNVEKLASTKCKNFLAKSGRRAQCYADFEYGQIEGIKVWKITATKSTEIKSFLAPGGSVTVCKGDPVNFESLNEPCVESVKFRLTGPADYLRNHNDSISPYFLFGDDGVVSRGVSLDTAGKYTLTLSPEADKSMEKQFIILVKNC